MVVVVFVDIDHHVIPNSISIGGLVVGLAASVIMPFLVDQWLVTPLASIGGALFGGGSLWAVSRVYRLATTQDGIGFGDVKLMAMIGAFFGWQVVLVTIFLSSLLGASYGVTLMLISGRSSKYPIPFGPFIVIGCLASISFGEVVFRALFPF